jgi:hypothetical protein
MLHAGPVPASSVAGTPAQQPVSLSFHHKSSSTSIRQLKGGLKLVFDPKTEGPDEPSIEELRASLPRYQKILFQKSISA